MQLSYRGIRYNSTSTETIDTATSTSSTPNLRYRGTPYSPDRPTPIGVSFDHHLQFLGATYSKTFFC